MHELESGIATWRKTMAEKLGQDQKVLDELEAHLRDEIDRLVTVGKSPADALTIAISRIGEPAALADQFARVSKPWLPIYLVGGSVALATVALSILIAVSSGNPLLRVHVAAVTIGYSVTYAIGVLSLCWAVRTLYGELPIGQRVAMLDALLWMSLIGLVFTGIGTVTGAVWASKQLGRFWSWDLREIGGILTMMWQAGLLVSLWRVPMKTRWLMSWGMLGKTTIIFAWFVAGTIAPEGFSATPAQLLGLEVLATHLGFFLILVAGLFVASKSRERRLNLT